MGAFASSGIAVSNLDKLTANVLVRRGQALVPVPGVRWKLVVSRYWRIHPSFACGEGASLDPRVNVRTAYHRPGLQAFALAGFLFLGGFKMNKRMGVIAIIVKDRKSSSSKVNEILTEYGAIIIGRMGVPYREKKLNVIALIVEANSDQIGALTGKLGMIPQVEVKSILITK